MKNHTPAGVLTPKALEGRKDDQLKFRYDLIPPELDLAVAAVLTFGAAKYDDRNWEKGMKWSRVLGALKRHIAAWEMGEMDDPETGLPHLWHVGCCVSFLISFEIREAGENDIPMIGTGFDMEFVSEAVNEAVARTREAAADRAEQIRENTTGADLDDPFSSANTRGVRGGDCPACDGRTDFDYCGACGRTNPEGTETMNTRERVAEQTYKAMLWARSQPPGRYEIPWVVRGNSLAQDEARRAADVSIAAVLDGIKPLVWDGFVSGPYEITIEEGGIANLHNHGRRDEEGDAEYLQGGYLCLVSMDDLKAVANAHHLAQIIAALGLEVR